MAFRETFVSNLPDDPDEALLTLADRASDWLNSADDGYAEIESVIITSILSAFIKRFRPEIFIFGDDPSVKDFVIAIMRHAGSIEVDRLVDKYEDQIDGKAGNFGKAELTSAEKQELHEHLKRVKGLVEASGLSVRKKNGLMERINQLIGEIDRFGTRTDRFFAFAGDLGFYMGEFAEKSAPLWKEVKDILKIVTKARARDENVALPPGDEVIMLPKPEEESDESSSDDT